MDKHYVDWLQVIKVDLSRLTLCDDHDLPAVAVVNGRTGGLTRTSTNYVCSPQCLFDVFTNARWKDK
jgi:hypothetical protein